MSNNNNPPFRIGQEVVALKDHSGLLFKKGDRFIISGVYGAECRCPFHWLVSVGILAPAPLCYCERCDYMFKSHKEAMFRATCFAPVQYSDITASLASEAMKERVEVDVVKSPAPSVLSALAVAISIMLTSCARYQFVAVPSKITIENGKVWTRETGNRVVIKDTTITGTMIHKVRVKWWEKGKVVHGGKL